MDARFTDRYAAGRRLAQALQAYRGRRDLVVLALPRGGVPVAYEVAKALDATLDVLIVRKLGLPHHRELAMGAIASGGAVDLNHDVIDHAGVSRHDLDVVLAEESIELERREVRYRGTRAPAPIEGRTVIVVDDGLATGSTMRAALKALRSRSPAKLIVAVPVAPADAERRLSDVADEFVGVLCPAHFEAVGQFYAEFGDTSDEEVQMLLREAHAAGTRL